MVKDLIQLKDRQDALTILEESRDVIKKTFCEKATPAEFDMFFELAKAIGANPFRQEIYFIKYDKAKATMPVSRAFLRKIAQAQPTHERQECHAIYSNDDFEVSTTMMGTELKHKRAKYDKRGQLIGAYSLTFDSKLGDHPHFEEVKFSDYNTGKSKWNTSPELMIRKCASAAGYRAVYTAALSGVYSIDEMSDEPAPAPKITGKPENLSPSQFKKAQKAEKKPEKTPEPKEEAPEVEAEVVKPKPEEKAPETPKEEEKVVEITWDQFDAWARDIKVSEAAIKVYHAQYSPLESYNKVMAKYEKYPTKYPDMVPASWA